jgi:hypothetical protein
MLVFVQPKLLLRPFCQFKKKKLLKELGPTNNLFIDTHTPAAAVVK